MAYQESHADVVSGENYRYALTNFRIAHEKVEEQRVQLQQQEHQVAQLRERIAVLEGTSTQQSRGAAHNGSTVDDFIIKNAASKLERLINRWAADVLRTPPASLDDLFAAALRDIPGGRDVDWRKPVRPIFVQSVLRHALAETLCEWIINCLIVTSSSEANIQLTRIHEHIFARDPTVAAVWRRQTFSAAVESVAPATTRALLLETLPALAPHLGVHLAGALALLDEAYAFSRMLHAAPSASGTFFRAFVPELGTPLSPRQAELVKRCAESEQGRLDRVGATIFPGLVKVERGPAGDRVQTVVRRAQVICQCALRAGSDSGGAAVPVASPLAA